MASKIIPAKTGKSENLLASLFDTILFDLGITPERFNILLDLYINAQYKGLNTKEASTLKGNAKKELTGNTLSWKGFIRRLSFLRVKKFKLTIEIYHENDVISSHNKMVVLSGDSENNNI